MNWVPKWFKPSGIWKSDQLNAALAQMFERLISSAPAVAMVRDVGQFPTQQQPPAGLISLAQRARNARSGQDKKNKSEKIKAGGRR
jgi:TetR/AcrR family transcriptional regulator